MFNPSSNFISPTTSGTSSTKIQPQITQQCDLARLTPYMLLLMMRNVSTNGFLFEDPQNPNNFSKPGCVIAAPSFPQNTPGVDQDYVFHWVRDAAITILEIAASEFPQLAGSEMLADYINFSMTCYNNATPTKGHACFTISGNARPWSEQNDGPAIQTIAILAAFDQLDAQTKTTAINLINNNVNYLLGVYQNQTTNLWEEHWGYSFFTRSVQLRCFREIANNSIGISVPSGVANAISWLEQALDWHWNSQGQYYISVADSNHNTVAQGYDVNIDIVSACIYGAVPCTDPKLLASAAKLRQQWSDPNSPNCYPINQADQQRGIGPLFGRYPSDQYDGDISNQVNGGHPWALCTANFAELYYTLAKNITTTGQVPYEALTSVFFAQVGINANTNAADAATKLYASADNMLRAILFHSDHLELSEQFDANTGYEKSVRNLTWSYAAFLSALRARG